MSGFKVTWHGRVPSRDSLGTPVKGFNVTHVDGREWYVYIGPPEPYVINTRNSRRVKLDGELGRKIMDTIERYEHA